MRSILPLLCVTALLWLASCAHQSSPSGGPEDKLPPSVAVVSPRSGTTGHNPRHPIDITFSEWVDVTAARRSVSLFPPLADGFRVRIAGKNMRIEPVKAFAESTTYHLELNNALKDLRGNTLGAPYHFKFSTGPALDMGSISGCVVDPGQRRIQPKVGLYRFEGQEPDTLLWGKPSYLVQTDTLGSFTLDHIRKGVYRLIAFIDANGDNRLQPGKETCYAPENPVIHITEEGISGIPLYPSSSDTLPVRVTSVRTLSSRLVLVETSLPWEEQGAPADTGWRIEPVASATSAPVIETMIRPGAGSRRRIAVLSRDLDDAGYRLVYEVRRRTGAGGAFRDSIRFNGTSLPDTIAPRPQIVSSGTGADRRARISITAAEPIRSLVAQWALRDTLGDSVMVRVDTLFTDTIVFSSARALRPGSFYRFSIPARMFEDLSGNRPGSEDTTVLSARLTVVEESKLAVALEGGAHCLDADDRRFWIFTPLGLGTPHVVPDRNGRFVFDSIPASRGTVSSFIDHNGNRRPTPGSLFPWRAPEPHIAFPDTLEARARWEVTGIELRACPVCPRR